MTGQQRTGSDALVEGLNGLINAWGNAAFAALRDFAEQYRRAAPTAAANPAHQRALEDLDQAVRDTDRDLGMALLRGRLAAKRQFDVALQRLADDLGVPR